MARVEGLPVHGYRPQAGAAVGYVNENKLLEEQVLRRLDFLRELGSEFPEMVDPRWLSIGRTAIEQGFMAINRAVFQPSRVRLPTDPPEPHTSLGE